MRLARRIYTIAIGLLLLLECAATVFNLVTQHAQLESLAHPLRWLLFAVPPLLLTWAIIALRGSLVAATAGLAAMLALAGLLLVAP